MKVTKKENKMLTTNNVVGIPATTNDDGEAAQMIVE